jgi:hypothetical protein
MGLYFNAVTQKPRNLGRWNLAYEHRKTWVYASRA